MNKLLESFLRSDHAGEVGAVYIYKGILTIAVVTKPFDFEGKKRMETALIGLEKLENSVDTLIVIPVSYTHLTLPTKRIV